MFFGWRELLGDEFVKEYSEKAITKATLDIFYDGQSYYRMIDGAYQTVNDGAMKIYLKEGCGVSSKVEATLHHIHENSRVTGAAPFVFRPPGLIVYNHHKVLNTWKNTVMQPAENAGDLNRLGCIIF